MTHYAARKSLPSTTCVTGLRPSLLPTVKEVRNETDQSQ